jgi:hypothetical protein
LRILGAQVQPPTFEALEDVARRRTRRQAVSATLAGVAVVVVLTFLAVVVTARDDRALPEPVLTPTPTPSASASPTRTATADASPTHQSATSMTPREVVTASDAQLLFGGVSADDPDFRIGVWEATCHWCPWNPDETRGPPGYHGLAITTDAFATTVYRRPPFDVGLIWHVESPGPGMLLLVDTVNGPEWLVRDDGTIVRLARVAAAHPGADLRSWHECHGVVDDRYDQVDPTGWCALDPASNTSYQVPSPWLVDGLVESRAQVSPGRAAEPWGLVWSQDDHLVAYWYDGGVRRTHDFGPVTASGAIHNLPRGEMAVWSLDRPTRVLTIHSSTDRGGTWRTSRLEAPFFSYFLALFRTDSGALLGLQDDAFWKDGSTHEGQGMRIWRADSADAGRFAVTYGARFRSDARGYEGPAFTELDGRIWSGGLFSDDDGRTWSVTGAWR